MLRIIKTYFHTQFVVILVLTIVVHNCFGQRFFSSSRSNRLVRYNPRYNDRQSRTIQQRRTQFGNYNNQNSVTSVVLSHSQNTLNSNRGVNFRRNGIRDRNGQTGRNTPNRRGNTYRRQRYSSPNQQNLNRNVRTYQNRPSNYNAQRNTRIYQRPVQQSQRRNYQEQNGRQNNNLNRRGRNRMHSRHVTRQQPRRQPGTSNNVLASRGGRRFVSDTRVRRNRNRGARNNNGVLAPQRLRFGNDRQEFRNRPVRPRTTRDKVVREAFKRTHSPNRSQDSLSVPIDRFMTTLRTLYDNRYGTNYDSTYYIPAAKSLPQGLEFVGQSYEAKRQSSSRNSGRQRNQGNQSAQGIAAKAFGSVLGISEAQISAIANAPSVYVRPKQLRPRSPYPLQDTRNVVNTPRVQVVTRNNLAETKAGLLTNIGNSIDQLTMQDKINMYNDLNTDLGDSNSKSDYNMPVKMIIISDANTFSKLKADASARGSILSALPSSAINEKLLNSATEERTPPTVVVERPSNQDNAKGERETESGINTRTVDKSVNDNKVTVVVRHVTRPARTIIALSRSSESRRNTRVRSRSNWNRINYYSDIFSNLINDRR